MGYLDLSVMSNSLPTESRRLMTHRKKPFENIVGKGENAGYQHFLLFPQCFLPFLEQISIFHSHLFCRLQTPLNLDQSKVSSLKVKS